MDEELEALMKLTKGQIIRIESIKHDGSFHRSWDRSVVLEDRGDSILLANKDVKVTEKDGHTWISHGLAVCQFHRKRWFNTILLFDGKKFQRFYCNIASPVQIAGLCLKYVDYDLDLVADSDLRYRWLDREEFEINRKQMQYPPQVIREVSRAVRELERRVREGSEPFTQRFVEKGHHLFSHMDQSVWGETRRNENK
jgi:uncharacterized protein